MTFLRNVVKDDEVPINNPYPIRMRMIHGLVNLGAERRGLILLAAAAAVH